MNQTTRLRWIGCFFCIFVFLSRAVSAEAEWDSRPASWEPRVTIGKSLSPLGNLLVHEQPGQSWRALGQDSALHSRDLLLALPGLKGCIENSPRAVELTLWGNLPKLSEFSGLESAVILHDSRSFDLDFTLCRGRVLVVNRKKKGPARVWLRVEGGAFQLTLNEPGDCLCLGLYSFWPSGVPFSLSQPEAVPVCTLNIVAVKGQTDVKVSGVQHLLSAPPGLCFFHWDSVNGPDGAPRRRRQLEAWANPTQNTGPKEYKQGIVQYQAAVKDMGPHMALLHVLSAARSQLEQSNERSQWEQAEAMAAFAVFGLAAINDMEHVMQALEDTRYASMRQAAATALRHWIANHPGRDRLLYQFLIDHQKYSQAHAATVLQLLHNAYAADDPATYETLIDYLNHPKLSIRELARQYLSRLVPEEVAVPYDPAAPPAERAKAYAAWKKAIPSGSLPTRKSKP